MPEDCGLLAGAIDGVPEQRTLLAAYTRSRGFYDGQRGLGSTGKIEGGAAPSGNLLVRRAAFEALGGFAEGIRSAGDFDLCWRAQAAGWRLIRRPRAGVAHRHRDDLASFLSMLARYGAGASWIDDRYPGASPRWKLVPGVLGSARDALLSLARREPREALYRGVDALGLRRLQRRLRPLERALGQASSPAARRAWAWSRKCSILTIRSPSNV